jgi:hypothetical protein
MADVRVKDLASTAATIADTDYVVVDSTADGTRKALATAVKTYAQTGVLATATTRTANTVYAGPATGADAAATFRALVAADIPDLSATYSTPAAVTSAISTALDDYTPTASLGDLATLDTVADAQVAAGAAIALSKLATVTASRALVSTAGGAVSASAVTATELGYLSGVTSAVQTQLAAKEPALGNPASDGYVLQSTAAGVRSWAAASGGLSGLTAGALQYASSATALAASNVYRESATVTAIRGSGASAQTLRIYRTYTDDSNGEWLELSPKDASAQIEIRPNANGTGTQRGLDLVATGGAGVTIQGGGVEGIKFTDPGVAHRWQIPTGTGHFQPYSDATYDLGTATMRVRDAYLSGGAAVSDAVTNAVSDALKLRHESSGTPAAGFGTGLLFQGESSTTPNSDMARMAASWTDATHATRTAKLTGQLVSNAGALADRWQFDHGSGAATTGFLLYDVDKGALTRVEVGAADSGGSGYRLLRLIN